jgi:tetratricopeptide (TPR) repeat protein
MLISPRQARKAAYFFLTLICGALLAILVYTGYNKWGPAKITVDNVPFGLAAGTLILEGDIPEQKVGLEQMSPATQQELRRASDLRLNGYDKEALEVYEALALQYPDVFLVQWGAVNALFDAESLNTAQETHRDVLIKNLKKKYPGRVIDLYVDSRVAERAGSEVAALELARLASEKAPSFFDARLLYANLLFAAARYSQATEETRAAISLSHGNMASPYRLLASLYHEQGSLDSCALVVEYALSKFPADEELLRLQGYLAEYKGRFDDAERIYRRILALRPDSKKANEALRSLGEKSPPGGGNSSTRLTPHDRAQVACDILEPLVQEYPDNLPLREALGQAYLKGRDFDQARKQFEEIENRDSEYPDIQLRLQEASATRTPVLQNGALAEDLNRALDSMRTTPSATHDFETSLGHYLVRYGATPKEFFAKYSMANFKEIKPFVWQEKFYESPYFHQYTVLFDSLQHFYGVHVLILDSNVVGNPQGRMPEVYSYFLQRNSRLSGIGNGTGETDCGGVIMDAAVWETQDNFEILAHIIGKPSEVRMIRLDRSVIPEGTKLCDYLTYLNKY